MAKIIDDILGDAKRKGSELWSNVKSAGRKKLKATIDNINKSLPVIHEAGFILVRLDVEIAIVPRLFARFRQIEILSEEKQEEVLEKTKKNRLINIMLLGLFQAVSVRKEVNIDGMDLKEIELEIGLTPSAKLIFRNEDRVNIQSIE